MASLDAPFKDFVGKKIFFLLTNIFYQIKENCAIYATMEIVICKCIQFVQAKLHSSVGTVQDLRTGSRWFDPWFGQHSF